MVQYVIKEIVKKIEARFFKLESIREPVREWLLDLDQDDRKTIGVDIKTVEFGWPIGRIPSNFSPFSTIPQGSAATTFL